MLIDTIVYKPGLPLLILFDILLVSDVPTVDNHLFLFVGEYLDPFKLL